VNKVRNEEKLGLVATKTFKPYDEMYKVVDFLNKNLKDRQLLFGLTRDVPGEEMIISIYEI
jgi:hypothetical protein